MKKPYAHKWWLEHQYSGLEKGAVEIALECQRVPATIYSWLKKFNILTRSFSEAQLVSQSNHVVLSRQGLEFINGLLLGDGGLTGYCKHSSSYENYSKYKEYPIWLSGKFKELGIKKYKIKESEGWINFPSRRVWAISHCYMSLFYIELKDLWSKWYKPATEEERKMQPWRKFIKIIPLDLELTPLTCLMWYIGDGCLGQSGRSRKITLSTQGFAEQEVKQLSSKMEGLGIKTTMYKDKTIYVWARSVSDFLDYIGPCPVRCYGYKWGLKKDGVHDLLKIKVKADI